MPNGDILAEQLKFCKIIPALQLKVDLYTELGLWTSETVEVWSAQLGFSLTLVETLAALHFLV